MMKKSIMILCSLLLCVSCVGCDGTAEETKAAETPADTAAAENTAAEETAPETYGYYDGLEEYDFNGYEFTLLSYNSDSQGWKLYLDTEELTGELLNDTGFNRNLEVESLLNCRIGQVLEKEYENAFRNSVIAGESETYDLVCFWAPGQRASFITENMTYDWNKIPNLRLDADWYIQDANDIFTFGDKLFFAVSDITFAGQQNSSILFNIGMLEDLQMEMPYEHVKNGTWTFDVLKSYIHDVYMDLDGNNAQNNADRHGIVTNSPNLWGRFMAASGEMEVYSAEDGFVLNLYSEKIVNYFEKILALTESNDTWSGAGSSNKALGVFKNNNSMFLLWSSDPAKLRDVDFDFGYLIFPKYDESQPAYITEAHGGLMAVPSIAKDIERTGTIIEAMSAASDKYIVDAFIQDYTESKILRDEESVEMYRLARDTYAYNISYNFDPTGLLNSHAFYSEMIETPTLSHASYYESIKAQLETAYAELWAACGGK